MDEKIGNQIERMMRILSILSEYRWTTAEELSKELSVDRRTIFRYIRDINIPFEENGIGLVESSRDGYRLYDTNILDKLKGIDDQYTVAAISFSPFGESLNSNPVVRKELSDKLLPRLSTPHYFSGETSRSLLEALLNNRILKVEYLRFNRETGTYTILPLRIVVNNEAHYLQCYCFDEGYETILNLLISKITSIKSESVCRDRTLIKDQLEYIESRWGTFINREYCADVLFETDELMLERLQRNPLHKSQEYHIENGKHLFSLKVHNAQEFARWTMKFGWHIKVIEPEMVIDILLDEAAEITKKYSGSL